MESAEAEPSESRPEEDGAVPASDLPLPERPAATMEDCLAKKMEITVSEAEKRTGRNAMNMQETYTAYLIETRWVMRTCSQ
ncbi:UNVERIFIED_CONTAM: hypothetical protein H355_007447 [Colinus virginianus]|nr:hypothetical protein H355_007447 [Colinus virginianus]